MPHTDPEIYVLNKRVRLLQDAGGFRTSLDSVMLAAACPAQPGSRVLDMGCGVGGAAFCVLHRVPESFVTGVDIQRHCIELARRNATLNSNTKRCEFIELDITRYEVAKEERFDHVICNPPYLEAGSYTPSPTAEKAAARGHSEKNLSVKEWIDAGLRLLKSGGSLTIIHRADAVDRIVARLHKRFGRIEIIPLWPRAGQDARRVIVRALKDRKSPAILHAGVILHNDDGTYTEATERILRDGHAL